MTVRTLFTHVAQRLTGKPIQAVVLASLMGIGGAIAQPEVAHAEDYESFSLQPGFLPDPVIGTGLSGGSRNSGDCGYVDTLDAPDHTLYIDESFDYLRLYVDAPGDVTLLMESETTGESICVDDSNGSLLPEFSGAWPAGTYNIWIGDFENNPSGTYRYRLYITEQ